MARSLQIADVFNIFVNRERELQNLWSLIADARGRRISVLTAGIDSGLSSAFLKAIHGNSGSEHLVYFDALDSRPEALFEQTVESIAARGQEIADRILVPLARPDKRKTLARLISGGFSAIPIAGSPISRLLDLTTDWFLVEPNGDRYNKKLSDLFQSIAATQRVVIVADHFQRAKPHHVSQLTNVLYSVEAASLLIGQNTAGKTLSKPAIDPQLSIFSSEVVDFPDPDVDLGRKIIRFINRANDLGLREGTAYSIKHGLRHFLEQIAEHIKPRFGSTRNLTQFRCDIICLLHVAREPLPVTLLFECGVENGFFIPDFVLFEREIAFLEGAGLASIHQSISSGAVALLNRLGDDVATRQLNPATRLYYQSCLYRTIDHAVAERRIAAESVGLLMYRLAGDVDERRVNDWSIATLRSCTTASNFIDAEHALRRIATTLSPQRETDLLTIVAACITIKKYDWALRLLHGSPFKTMRTQILESILLYRNLQLDPALDAMDRLWKAGVHGNDACLLATYFVGLCIDLGIVEQRENEVKTWLETFASCRSYGYFLNIVAATREPGLALDLCERSRGFFHGSMDQFGDGGAIANIGVHRIKKREFRQSIDASLEANELLSAFGIQHIHLVANNLGCAHLMLGEFEEGRVWLSRCLAVARTATVRAHALTNLAAVAVCEGNLGAGLASIRAAVDVASMNPIADVKRNVLRNVAVLLSIVRRHDANVTVDLVGEAQGLTDAFDIGASSDTPEGGDEAYEHILLHYKPLTNQYWYPNPMDLFDEKGLSVEAYVENLAN